MTFSSYRRSKKKCPMCGKEVFNLPNHLQSKFHQLSKSEALLTSHNSRKTYAMQSGGTNKLKNYHVKRRCPIGGCERVVTNISEHLRKFHKKERDLDYVRLLKAAAKIGVDGLAGNNLSYFTRIFRNFTSILSLILSFLNIPYFRFRSNLFHLLNLMSPINSWLERMSLSLSVSSIEFYPMNFFRSKPRCSIFCSENNRLCERIR